MLGSEGTSVVGPWQCASALLGRICFFCWDLPPFAEFPRPVQVLSTEVMPGSTEERLVTSLGRVTLAFILDTCLAASGWHALPYAWDSGCAWSRGSEQPRLSSVPLEGLVGFSAFGLASSSSSYSTSVPSARGSLKTIPWRVRLFTYYSQSLYVLHLHSALGSWIWEVFALVMPQNNEATMIYHHAFLVDRSGSAVGELH